MDRHLLSNYTAVSVVRTQTRGGSLAEGACTWRVGGCNSPLLPTASHTVVLMTQLLMVLANAERIFTMYIGIYL